jgi:nickel/cobalt exporter
MPNPLLLDSLLLGLQHSFEPDHVAAVSVLATEKNRQRNHVWRLLWRSSQWALGHSLTLISFGVLVLVLKSTFSLHVAGYVEFFIGPIMIWLGLSAYQRNFRKPRPQADPPVHGHSHAHGAHHPRHQTDGLKPRRITRSFWIGMVHGLAGTGTACTIALTLAAKDAYTAVWILVIQSVSIITAMTTYGYLFAVSVGRFAGKWQPSVKGINYVVGTFSILVGIYILIESIKSL